MQIAEICGKFHIWNFCQFFVWLLFFIESPHFLFLFVFFVTVTVDNLTFYYLRIRMSFIFGAVFSWNKTCEGCHRFWATKFSLQAYSIFMSSNSNVELWCYSNEIRNARKILICQYWDISCLLPCVYTSRYVTCKFSLLR
jgi:hypothetical protein